MSDESVNLHTVPTRRYEDEEDDQLVADDDDELHDDSDLDEEQVREQQSAKAEKARKMLDALARRIRSLRERRGMTQDDFATRCDISVSFASLLERGERSPSYETLVTIAEALEVPLADLFKEPGNDQPEDPYHGRLIDFARKARLNHAQVDRFIAVGHAMFEVDQARPGEPPKRPASLTCTVAGCGKQVLARGLCTSHYHKARRGRA